MSLLNSKIAAKFIFFLLFATLVSLFSALGVFVTFYVSTGTYPSLFLFIGVSVGTSLISSLLLGTLFVKLTLSPIKKIKDALASLATGNANINVQIKSHDEFEEMANQLNSLILKTNQTNKQIEVDKYLLWAERNKELVTFSSIADGIIGLDGNQKVTIFNKAAETITGIPIATAMGKDLSMLFKILDEEKKEVLPSLFCPIRHDEFEGVVWTGENLTLKTVEKEVPIALTSSKIKESAKASLGCIITIHDTTKEKQFEQMKLDFVSMAAHELRTPITSIGGYLSVFTEEMGDKIPPPQKELLDKMDFATKQILSLVDNMLNVSRIERGVFSVTVTHMDYLDLVDKIISELAQRAKIKNQVLEYVKPAQEDAMIEGDKIRLGEVLSNLIANAINYTPSGGHIKVWIDITQTEIITHVQDNGRGIPKEALPNLFKKFYRVVNKLEQSSKGNGLGLYISKAIIDVHHGKIWAESVLGKGSTFNFSLPYQQFQYQTFSQTDLGLKK